MKIDCSNKYSEIEQHDPKVQANYAMTELKEKKMGGKKKERGSWRDVYTKRNNRLTGK